MESFYTPNNPNFAMDQHWTPPSPSSPESCKISPICDSANLFYNNVDSASHFTTCSALPPQVQDLFSVDSVSPVSQTKDYFTEGYSSTTVPDFDPLSGFFSLQDSSKYISPMFSETAESGTLCPSKFSAASSGGLSAHSLTHHSLSPSGSSLHHPRLPVIPPQQSYNDGGSPYFSSIPPAAMSVNLSMNMTLGVNYSMDNASWNAPLYVPQVLPQRELSSTSIDPSFSPAVINGIFSPMQKTQNAQINYGQSMCGFSPTGLGEESGSSLDDHHQHIFTHPPPLNDCFLNSHQESEKIKPRSASGRKRTSSAEHQDEDSSSSSSGIAKPNLCRICGKTYARPSTLKTHLRTHSGERPYRCTECNKSFSQAANLTAHVRTHSGEKPFKCLICYRRFSQSSSVTTHMRTHSGERPYRCRMCKKAFSDSSTLTKHMRIHSGEKPYQCGLCLLRFSQSGNLNRHMRVHATSST